MPGCTSSDISEEMGTPLPASNLPAKPDRIQLLMIDDDIRLCHLVRDDLSPHGFNVSFVHSGPEGLATAAEAVWDVVILDVLLPGIGAFEVLRRLRAVSDVPVLMLTGLGDETNHIVGSELGADDYLPKTFSMRELLARLRALLRRRTVGSEKPDERIL
jgi:DNA-binding response OmpR family regulator